MLPQDGQIVIRSVFICSQMAIRASYLGFVSGFGFRASSFVLLPGYRRLFDSQDVGHGVEGGGLVEEPFGGAQGASDKRVVAVGRVVQGDRLTQGAVKHGVDSGYVAGADRAHADFAFLSKAFPTASTVDQWEN